MLRAIRRSAASRRLASLTVRADQVPLSGHRLLRNLQRFPVSGGQAKNGRRRVPLFSGGICRWQRACPASFGQGPSEPVATSSPCLPTTRRIRGTIVDISMSDRGSEALTITGRLGAVVQRVSGRCHARRLSRRPQRATAVGVASAAPRSTWRRSAEGRANPFHDRRPCIDVIEFACRWWALRRGRDCSSTAVCKRGSGS
jgi:hypothetical protein